MLRIIALATVIAAPANAGLLFGPDFSTRDGCFEAISDHNIQRKAAESRGQMYERQMDSIPPDARDAFAAIVEAMRARADAEDEILTLLTSICAAY